MHFRVDVTANAGLGIPILLQTNPHTRYPDLDDVSVQSCYVPGPRTDARAPVRGSGPFRYGDPSSHDAELTCIQYAMIFVPGLIVGRLCDLGYFKRTLFISRSVARSLFHVTSVIQPQTRNQRVSSRSGHRHGRMQGVLATTPLPGSPDWAVLRDDLRPDPCHRFTVVQETEIFGVEHRCRRIVTGRNDYPDCRKQPYRAHWVCDDIIRAMRVTDGFPQVQMDNTGYCPDRILHARDCEFGRGICDRLS